jgi:chromosome segregation ATPase
VRVESVRTDKAIKMCIEDRELLQEKDDELEDLYGELAGLTDKMAEKTDELADLTDELAEMKAELGEKERSVEYLSQLVGTLRARKKQLKQAVATATHDGGLQLEDRTAAADEPGERTGKDKRKKKRKSSKHSKRFEPAEEPAEPVEEPAQQQPTQSSGLKRRVQLGSGSQDSFTAKKRVMGDDSLEAADWPADQPVDAGLSSSSTSPAASASGRLSPAASASDRLSPAASASSDESAEL